MSNNTLRPNARTTTKAVFTAAPDNAFPFSVTIPENSAVTVKFRTSGEYDLWITVENPGNQDLVFIRRDVPRSAFELYGAEVSSNA